LKEFYLGEGCPLDSAKVRIINDAADEVKDTTISNGSVVYSFKAGKPNPSPPFLQNIQIIGTSLSGNESSLTRQVLVTGLFSKSSTFTTQLPQTPSLVLRDPPGDGSYAYLEKNENVCQNINFSAESSSGFGTDVVLDLGPDADVLVFATILSIETHIGPTFVNSTTITKRSESSMEVCNSYDERISTSAEDLIVGPAANLPGQGWVQGGDVFVGGGLNVEFGFSDKVSFDQNACAGAVETVVSVSPRNFGTTFMYSDNYIRNNVIRYLNLIANDPNTSQAKKDTCLTSIALWNKILNDNELQKKAAKFKRNLSFDAGSEYEYSETSDTLNATSTSTDTSKVFDFAFDILVFAQGIGGGVTIHTTSEKIKGKSQDNSHEKGITTGYVLADNDPGDAFTVDVAMDSVYKTPVFRTVTGQSSCPWEPKTAHREGTGLAFRDGSSAVAVDVPANEPAVFKFNLGNQSETNETRTYVLASGVNSNPDGAIIRLNGAELTSPVGFQVEYGTSVPITITLERGPEQYTYDSLEIAFYSECEDDRANALGLPSDADKIAYSNVYISAH
ncbi:MAG: hypothetical protein WCR52_24635, partial [Bacteroidota bacterium]